MLLKCSEEINKKKFIKTKNEEWKRENKKKSFWRPLNGTKFFVVTWFYIFEWLLLLLLMMFLTLATHKKILDSIHREEGGGGNEESYFAVVCGVSCIMKIPICSALVNNNYPHFAWFLLTSNFYHFNKKKRS